MANMLVDRLVKERRDAEGTIQNVQNLALDQNRDLTDADIATITSAQERISQIDVQLEAATKSVELDESVRSRLSSVAPTSSYAQAAYRTAGEVMWDVLHQVDRDASARFASVQRRAAEHMGTDAAKTTPTAGGFGGLTVVPVTGPIIELDNYSRPFVTALGVRQSPNPEAFRRPRLIDPSIGDGVAAQSAQKAELTSKHFNILSDTIELTTVGGYLNVSQQLLSLHSSALDVVLTQLNRRLAVATERMALSFVDDNSVVTSAGVDFTDGAAVRKAIFAAAASVYDATGALPEWIAMGPVGWAALGSLVDAAGRPLFPALGPVNAMGSASPGTFDLAGLGFQGIVTPAIADGSLFVGNGIGAEIYEYPFPVLEAVEPSVLGRQIAVASAVGLYAPPTTEASGDTAAVHAGIAKITAA